ncbi:urease accessory protein UreF [Rubellimicrobium sp. CFH 75288]|uniref:urease accessory protein UreF n=1 Tax=Rubellimicrobium sp. CFH 75288 TaxID=2697034 RepID=UPI001411F0E3|nr:urease accessory UreF family protein [Rubellimicrobium sp. CFH 75288]NAZ36230.1 urease accessory protein UreF [Rubellimicrobium sp. CFH 75288]
MRTGITVDDGALLLAARWLSPAFPTGAFAWSHGLEQAVAEGAVRDGTTLRLWIAALLRHGAGWTDAVLTAAAWRGEEDLAELAELAAALAPSPERREETLAQGAALAATLRAVHGWDLPDASWPVALGRAARLAGVPLSVLLPLALQAFATNLVAAGQRLMPLGQTEGQRALVALGPLCTALAVEAERTTLEDLGGAAFWPDILSLRHETLEPRLFRS